MDWREINELFHRALDEPADRRDDFLNRACAGRPDLRQEIASLLAAHLGAEGFMEQPIARASQVLSAERRAADPLVGRVVGPYKIDSVIGEGGMGIVYRAEDTRLGRTIALKAVAPRFAGDEQKRERLRREARAAAALNHPGIATVYALEEIDGELYIATEYVAGETLRRELRQFNPSPIRAIEIGLAIARAMAAAHERGIVHRDLKPENIMRTASSGQIKILDFGLARLADHASEGVALTLEGMRLGTPAYMAPEQIRGRAVDFRADLFAFGILLTELATGRHPFSGRDDVATIANILEVDPSLPMKVEAKASEQTAWTRLHPLIRACLAKQPEDRFGSTHDLVEALEAARLGLAPREDGRPASTRRSITGRSAFWWWQFHQAAASAGYLALLVPLSYARASERDLIGLVIFFLGLVASLAASSLRLHLWFAVRAYPFESASQRRRSTLWIRISDITFVVVLLTAASMLAADHDRLATLLVASAVAVLVSFAIVEPATARAAERDGSPLEMRSH